MKRELVIQALIEKVEGGSYWACHYDEEESSHWWLIRGKRYSFILKCSPMGYFMPYAQYYRHSSFLDRASLRADWNELQGRILTRKLTENTPYLFGKAQLDTLTRVSHKLTERYSDAYELKKVEWSEPDFSQKGAYFLSFAVGLKDDEGTLAEAIGRDRYFLLLGSRGGLKVWDGDRWLKGRKARVLRSMR